MFGYWQRLAATEFGGGRVSMVARRARGGQLVDAGLVYQASSTSFPHMFVGGGAGSFPQCRQILAVLRETHAALAAAWNDPRVGEAWSRVEALLRAYTHDLRGEVVREAGQLL